MSPQPPMGNGIDERRTPSDLFERLHALHDFTLDGAASHENALLPTYCTTLGTFAVAEGIGRCLTLDDGLQYSWALHRVFINPPYGRGLLEPFVRKAWTETRASCPLVVALLPVRTEQPWFHNFVLGYAEIEFIRGRLKYDGLKQVAPFPSMIVTWRRG